MIEVGKAIVKCLEMENISVVFGYPGAAICPFYDELEKSNIRHILIRHEANGGHSANGYARISGKPAVCIATSGPGATNLITAIATAYMDSIPLIIITGQVNSDLVGRDVFQEADITGSAEPFVKHSYLVKDSKTIPKIFKEAFYIAGSGRPGPVLIDIPMDIQKELIEFEYPKKAEIKSYNPTYTGNKLQIKRAVSAINKSEKPLICTGGGVFFSNCSDELKTFAEKCNIPVVSTMMGLSSISSSHPLYCGMVGVHGVKSATVAVKECDTLILIGARISDRTIPVPNLIENKTIIHIDIDPAEIGKNVKASIPVVGDAKNILKQILLNIDEQSHDKWIEKLDSYKLEKKLEKNKNYVNPKLFMKKLSKALPEYSVVVADVGQNQIWAANGFCVNNGRFLTSGGMGTMGYSVPAAIGAKLADPSKTVLAVCGDGSFQMQMMELATIIQHNLDIKIIIMSNNRLGMVHELQKKLYSKPTAVFLDGNPDFIKLSKAYGIDSIRINSDDEIDNAISSLINSDNPFLLECIVDPDQSTL